MTIPIKIIKKKDYEKEQSRPEQENVWDSISIPWGKYIVKRLPFIEKFLKNKSGLVIDLGCGSGRNMIPNKNITYYAIDFSSGQIMHAREYANNTKDINARVFKMSIDRLSKKEFKDNMFDYGLFIATLHCLETRTKRKNSLKELFRVLKPGAEAIVTVWDSTDKRFEDVGNKGDIYMSWKDEGIPYMRYYYLYEKEELLDLLKEVGFKIKKIIHKDENNRFTKKNLIIFLQKPKI